MDPEVNGLVVGANGYVRQEFEREDFPEKGKSLVVRMTATGIVSGVVRGEGARPLANVSVQLLRYVYSDSGQRSLKPFGSAKTNDLGEYRLFGITPGRYYLRAGTNGRPYDDSFAGIVSPLFYPGDEDTAQATIVEVESGQERKGLDFILKQQQSYRIRGRLVETSPEHAADSQNSLRLFYIGGGFSTGDDVGNLWSSARLSADGTFEFRDIVPGLYAIAGGDNSYRGLATVRIGNSDIDNVVITLSSLTVKGRIHFEGTPLSSDDSRFVGFNLLPLLPFGTLDSESWLGGSTWLQSSGPEQDGTFAFIDVISMDYRLEMGWLASGYYLKRAELDGVDVLSRPFHPYSADGILDVILSSNGGQISATVVDEKGRPLRGVQAALVPDRTRDRIDLYRSATADRDGKVSFDGIPPGDYKLFAWESVEDNSWFDPEVIRRFDSKGKSVHVGVSSKQTVQVRVIPASK